MFLKPNSGVLVCPSTIKPARSSVLTKALVRLATDCASSFAPAVLGSPARSCPKPFIRMGTPPKGRPSKLRLAASAKALSSRVDVTALIAGLCCWILAKVCSSSWAGVVWRFLICAARASASMGVWLCALLAVLLCGMAGSTFAARGVDKASACVARASWAVCLMNWRRLAVVVGMVWFAGGGSCSA